MDLYVKTTSMLVLHHCYKRTISFLDKTDRWLSSVSNDSDCALKKHNTRSDLHNAVISKSTEQVLQLLQTDVDVNALDEYERTPLYYAMFEGDIEVICMLLYHGADVIVSDIYNDNPFSHIYTNGTRFPRPLNVHVLYSGAKILIDYFDEKFLKSSDGIKAFLVSAYHRSPIAIDLLKAGCSISDSTSDSYYLQTAALYHSLNYESAELFKLVWSKLDYDALNIQYPEFCNFCFDCSGGSIKDIKKVPFLICYIMHCRFPIEEWVECLYTLLGSPVACDLLEACIKFQPSHRLCEAIFIHELIEVFCNRMISKQDRICITYTLLSLGAITTYSEFNVVFQTFGFSDELEGILYNIKSYDVIMQSKIEFLLMPIFILGCEDNYSQTYILDLYQKEIITYNLLWTRKDRHLLNSIGYFALPEYMISKLRNFAKSQLQQHEMVCSMLDKVPNVPSLVELSRNAFRKHTLSSCKFQYPYQFHEFVKKLQVSEHVKDIIRFKVAIYY